MRYAVIIVYFEFCYLQCFFPYLKIILRRRWSLLHDIEDILQLKRRYDFHLVEPDCRNLNT